MNAISRRSALLATLTAAGGMALGLPAHAITMGPMSYDQPHPDGGQEISA